MKGSLTLELPVVWFLCDMNNLLKKILLDLTICLLYFQYLPVLHFSSKSNCFKKYYFKTFSTQSLTLEELGPWF